MIELSRGLSFVQYTYEGGPLRFTVPFPFLLKEHVRVLVGDPASPRTVLATWIDSTTLEIPDQSQHLAAPYAVTLRRFTPFDKQSILFQDGPSLHAKQLNTAIRQLLYAHQELREFPVGSTGNPGGGNPGIPGGGIPDIQTIIDLVTQSPAFLILQEKIPDVDANAELIMEELLRSNSFFDLHRDHGDKISTAYTRISLTEDTTQVLAEQYTELFTRIVTTEQDIAAQFLEVNQAVVTEREARVSSMTDLHAQITTERNTYVAQSVSNVTALVNAVESRVDTVEGTVASHRTDTLNSIAATNQSLSTVANAQGANTEWRQLFAAQFGPAGATGTSVASAVKQEINTKVTASEAQTISNTSVTAFANGTFAALQQSYNAYVNSNNGRWDATWALRINGGDPQNPIVAGIALSAYPGGSDFVVQSDRFAIVSPTQYGQKKFPFVVGTVGGVGTVGITGQLLVDGSITANKLTVNSLAAITANAGTINGGTFKTHTLDAAGNVVDANEFRFEASNVGTWPIWVGSGAKTENNAVFWVDRAGNAGFKGRVTAPNIVGQFQSATAVNWTGARTITFANAGIQQAYDYQEVTQFTLPPPVLVGELHTPVVQLTVGCTPGTAGLDLILQEMRASVWVEIGRYDTPYYDSSYMINGGSGNEYYSYRSHLNVSCTQVSGIGQATSSARTFRVVARCRDIVYTSTGGSDRSKSNTTVRNVTYVTGSVIGIR